MSGGLCLTLGVSRRRVCPEIMVQQSNASGFVSDTYTSRMAVSATCEGVLMLGGGRKMVV